MSERNHEVIKSQQLLDEYGNIAEPGWSRKQLQQYSRTQIKAPKFRIKEWDYYLVVGDDCAVAFTLSDDGYVGLQSVSLLEFFGRTVGTYGDKNAGIILRNNGKLPIFLQKKS